MLYEHLVILTTAMIAYATSGRCVANTGSSVSLKYIYINFIFLKYNSISVHIFFEEFIYLADLIVGLNPGLKE